MSFSPKREAYHQLTSDWFKAELNRCLPFLKMLDRNPEHLESFVESESRQLLGKKFELFVEYWIRHSGAYDLLLNNEQIQVERRTIGEVDFVLKHLDSVEIWHLEVACKYYLGAKNSGVWADWLGINATDSLHDKMLKFDKQLSVFQRAEGRELLQRERITQPKSFLLMKGFFFYEWRSLSKCKSPRDSTDNQNTGVYLKVSDMKAFFSGFNSWVVLSKRHWFSEYTATEHSEVYSELTIQNKVSEIIAEYDFGVMLARLSSDSDLPVENLRVVVVPDRWPCK